MYINQQKIAKLLFWSYILFWLTYLPGPCISKFFSVYRPHFTQNVSFFPLQSFWHLNPQCNSVFDSTGSGESEWKQGKWNKLDESRWKMVMYRWVCFEENYSMITKLQPFPHSVFRMGVSQVCQFFQFYVWKFCRFQIAHLRRFRACFQTS